MLLPFDSGMAEKICIGCVQIRPCTNEEKNSFNLDSAIHDIVKDLETPLNPASDHDHLAISDINEVPCIQLGPVNPHSSSFMTVLIHNFRY